MGDQGEIGRAMRAHRQEMHADWHRANIQILRASGLRFEERETAVLFREPGRPRVDFYPHTGRWREVGGPETTARSGGARAFLAWYAKQALRAAKQGER